MKWKKLIAVTMAACSIISMTAGCSTGKSNNNGSGNTSGEKVKLTALINKHSLTKDLKTMKWLTDLEQKTNVQIEWQQISADWDQKKAPMFASGEIPDILINCTATSDYAQYNGLFADLTPLIQKDGPNLTQMFKDRPEIKNLVTQTDGKIYSAPRFKGGIWPDSVGTCFINKTWLNNLGLKEPTTWDELEQVLIAFRDKDPNKNGKKDEIPMDFNGMTGGFGACQLLGGEGLQLTDSLVDGYFAEDGTVKDFFVDPRYKKLVKFLAKLWSEGLINKDTVTNDYSKFQSTARGTGNAAAVGFTWGWETGDRFGNNVSSQYESIGQLKESNDVTPTYTYDYYSQNYDANAIAMSANCANKDAAMKFVDGFYNPVVSMQVLFGGMNSTDKCIKDDGNGKYEILPPADSSIDPGTWKWTNSMADNGPFYISDKIKNNLKLGVDMQRVTKEKAIYKQYTNKVDPKKNVYPEMFMKFSQSDLNAMAVNQANIDNITSSAWSGWMTGHKNIDTTWAAYVKSINTAGLTQNLKIRQAAYESYLKTLK